MNYSPEQLLAFKAGRVFATLFALGVLMLFGFILALRYGLLGAR
jgi:hypothetical protein